MESLEEDRTHFKGEYLRVEQQHAAGCLQGNHTAEEHSSCAVPRGVVGVTVEQLVGGDDGQPGEDGSEGAELQHPVPADLGGTRGGGEGTGPRGETEHSLRHEHHELQGKGRGWSQHWHTRGELTHRQRHECGVP